MGAFFKYRHSFFSKLWLCVEHILTSIKKIKALFQVLYPFYSNAGRHICGQELYSKTMTSVDVPINTSLIP